MGVGSDKAAMETNATFASHRHTVFMKCKEFTS